MDQCITHTCARCGLVYELEPPHYKRTWCRPCKLEYLKTYNRTYTPPEASRASKCATCGIDFLGRKSRQKYCSDKCRYFCSTCEPGRVDGVKRTCPLHRHPSRCLWCDTWFISNKGSRYCQQQCRDFARHLLEKLRQPQVTICAWCFTPFPYRLNKQCCSAACRTARNLHLKQYRAPTLCHLPVCQDCGEPHGASLEAYAVRKHRCSRCAEERTRARERSKWGKRDAKRRRREAAIKDGDDIDAHVLAELNGWICHLCNEPINPDYKWPHVGALTIDHVIPLTPYVDGDEPGTHTWDNVRPAHSQCNSRRQNRPIAS